MLSYYISQSNEFVIRTQDTASCCPADYSGSEDLTMILEDMMTYSQSYYPLPTSSYSWNPFENILTFSQSLEGSVETAQEFFVTISGSVSGSIYNGSMQVYASQSAEPTDKTVYTTQNEEFISNVTDNNYIVI
jgi:hypothetical protein